MRIALVVVLALASCSCALIVEEPATAKGGHEVVVCHKGKKTMTLPREAADAHIKHGDRYGAC